MNRARIASVRAWEALDSRGRPTVACEVRLAGGARGVATAPSGASTGSHEAHELRDGGERYGWRGVLRAVGNVHREIAPAVAQMEAADQEGLDRVLRQLDGTPDLSRLGANAVLAVSVAAALAAADAEGLPLHRLLAAGAGPLLPLPMVNVISGGAHAGRAVDFQDFLVVPTGAGSFAEAIEWAWRVRAATAELASERGLEASLVADEGGIGPRLPSNRDALELLAAGIERSGLLLGEEAAIAIDAAATRLAVAPGAELEPEPQPDENEDRSRWTYALASEQRTLASSELVEELEAWCERYPIVSIEDPLAEDDWAGWAAATRVLGGRVQLVGDDLFATDVERLRRGIAEGAANAVLVKPNQAGTLSAARACVERARLAGYATIVSARSGDTEDSWLADVAVGWRAGQIKVGSLTRSERTAKWNRLLAIEADLGAEAEFAGGGSLAPHSDRR